MDAYQEILRALGRIEGELIAIRKLSDRVAKLELWQYWLKGAWAVSAVVFMYLCHLAFGR
jgi:hypothetical protein